MNWITDQLATFWAAHDKYEIAYLHALEQYCIWDTELYIYLYILLLFLL